MDIAAAIASLRVVRRFEDRPLEPAHLEAILNAGRRASSSKNSQRWGFIVVTERALLLELAAVGTYAGHLAGAAAAVALILTAWSLGIGSCPATVYDPDLTRRLLGYPEGMACEYFLSFGYPADPTALTRPLKPGGRRPLDEIVHRERW